MKVKRIIFMLLAASLVVACAQKVDDSLDSLLKQKAALKAQVAELDVKIKAADTSKVEILPLVEVATVLQEDFQHKIAVQGTIETDKDVLVNAEMGGVITKIYVKAGDKVRKGQTLVTIDAAILSSNVNEVKTQLEFANYMLEKQEELKNRGVGSEFDYKQAKNQVDGLKSKLKTLGTQQGKAIVRAPFSGVIDQVFPKSGEMAGPQAPLLRIVNNDKVKITADISERHYATIKEGTPVSVYVPTLKDTFMMNVAMVGQYINPVNRTFRVEAELKNNKTLLPNMLAELNITDLDIKDALIVPTLSILKSQQNESYLYVVAGSKDRMSVRKVIVNELSKYKGETVVEVVKGELSKGEQVVSVGARGITEQDNVRLK